MKKMSMLMVTLTVLLANVLAQQSTGGIKGKVTTSDDKPAESVTVVIKNAKKNTLTGEDGTFMLRNMQPGNYEMELSLVGYETELQQVSVVADKITDISFQLRISDKQLQEVIVRSGSRSYKANTASSSLRLQTPVLETPQNIQIITSKAIADQQIISMSDNLIRNVSGVVRSEHWGDLYANISSRGSQVQAFRNGFNIVNSNWGPLTQDMSFVENIEFVKGPAGFMLSSGDPGGLYNVVTKKPSGQTKGEATLTAGSFDLYRATLDLDGKLNSDGKLLYRFNVSAQNKKAHRPNEYNDRYVIAPVISYQLDERTKLTFEYDYQRANMSNIGSFYIFSPNAYADYPVDFTTLPAGTPGTKIDDHSIYLNLQHDISKNWKLTTQVAQFIYNQEGASMWPSTLNPDGKMIRTISIWDAKSNMKMAQAFVNGEIITGAVRHRILGGLDMANKEYLADWMESHDLDVAGNEFDPHNPDLGIPVNGFPEFDRSKPLKERAQYSYSTNDQRYTSIYLQDELGLWRNRARLTLAGRYTDLSQSDWGEAATSAKHFTPRIGLSVSLDKQAAVYALYDQAFIPQAGRMANGKKVQPITGSNMEIGIKKDWFGGRWNTALAIYRILKNNELTADPNSPPASGLSIELGRKVSKGVEFDLRGTVANGLNIVANYAYTDSRVTKVAKGVTYPAEGDIVPGFAKHTINTWLTYKIQTGILKGTGFSAGYTWLMDRATYWEETPDPSKRMKDYFRLDAGLFWERDKIRITANVFNVLNKYLYSASYESWMTTPAYTWQTEAPRNSRISFSYRF